jgi:hypothetical protein
MVGGVIGETEREKELCSNLVYRSGLMKVEEAAHRC